MDAVNDLVLALYRAARDCSAIEFPDLALNMLKSLVPFRTATLTNAQLVASRFRISGVHLHEEPSEMLDEFASLNQTFPVTVSLANSTPRAARILDAPALYGSRDQTPMREYLARYSHQRNLIIADIEAVGAPGSWLSLYRSARESEFEASHARIISTLMPHLVEAIHINRTLFLVPEGASNGHARVGSRALLRSNGLVVSCGRKFASLIHLEYPGWDEVRLPKTLMAVLISAGSARIAQGRVQLRTAPIGPCLFVTAIRLSAIETLGRRQYEIARRFSAGRSHKQIANELDLAPATIRNTIQHCYRKLGVSDKAALAQLFAAEEG